MAEQEDEKTYYYGFVDVSIAVPFVVDFNDLPADWDKTRYDWAVEQFISQFKADPMKFIVAGEMQEAKVEPYLQITDEFEV